MSDYPYHQSLRLQNLTAFQDVTLEFVTGVNAFVGENGTGKTHIMKALYAIQLAQSRRNKNLSDILSELFQTPDISDLVRLGTGKGAIADVSGRYNDSEWSYAIQRAVPAGTATATTFADAERPVFIPAIDMMGHTRGFLQAASEVVLDFDLTCRDMVSLLGLERRNGNRTPIPMESLSELLGGTLEYDQSSSRFYLMTALGRLPMPLVSEGLRKIATLVRLAQNGWITPGTTLFWDEPEVNLNPKLMDEVIGAIFALTRAGVQVFLATHSYVILKELDLQARQADSVRFFGFQRNEAGTTVNATDDFTLLDPNSILDQYNSLYDRELTRATGRNRHGERVR